LLVSLLTKQQVQTRVRNFQENSHFRGSKTLAYIEFDPTRERLSFVNFGVSLSRNILLLGVSGKKGNKELVGQVICVNKNFFDVLSLVKV
jgi:hypothetical protein